MFYVYILQSKSDKSYYTGFTEDLEKRLNDHNEGRVTYTSGKRPYELVWHCAFKDKSKAIAFEKYLKSGSGIAFSRKRFL